MSAPATHPCDACGGSGIGSGLRCPCHGAPSTCCPVCLGAGRISDRMPVADALADAETLRMVAREVWTYGAGVYALRKYAMALVVGGMGRPLFKTREERNRNIATHRARAAFRAVPKLRGE